ncbi:MAG: CDGSH iron-sulfur domain-containing protein [Gemmatimonadota bacterium]|nr:MAG: CDGSH iron-sulfur domain-containing protein [Gemmatimonadota bacterium]
MSGKIRDYEGRHIIVRYDGKRCIHAEECVKGLPEVFDPDRKPWISPEAGAANQVAEVVSRCPTGALHFQRKDGGPAEILPEANTIAVARDGPLYARGDIHIARANGEVLLEDTRIALCRCGTSSNKPYCDGRHTQAAFSDPGAVNKAGDAVDDFHAGGKLTIVPALNGPLLLQGAVEIRSADGTATFRGQKAALCRCGASKNKPFCDGSHKTIRFSAD